MNKKIFVSPAVEVMQCQAESSILVPSNLHIGEAGATGRDARKQDNPTVDPTDNTKPQGIEF